MLYKSDHLESAVCAAREEPVPHDAAGAFSPFKKLRSQPVFIGWGIQCG